MVAVGASTAAGVKGSHHWADKSLLSNSVPCHNACASGSRATFQQGKARTLDPQRKSVYVGGWGLDSPGAHRGPGSSRSWPTQAVSIAPLPPPWPASSHTWLGSACWQRWPTRNRTVFAMHISLHPHKRSCQKENIFMFCGGTDVPQGGSN